SYATGKIYTIKVVSERGNIENGQYPPPPSPESQIALIAKGVGPVLTEFESFKWYSFGKQTDLNGLSVPTDESLWNPGWSIPDGTESVIWKVTVINHDLKDIYLDKRSIFTIMITTKPTAVVYTWYVVNVTGTPPVVRAYTGSGIANDGSIKIPANPGNPALGGTPTTIYFAVGESSKTKPSVNAPSTEGTYVVLITLQGKWSDGTLYAQTLIPIIAIEVV
ncbi:MAG: hypothetical protein ACUVTD_08960, partial [Nitrososphaerales archaeon]